ncbi:MAG: cell wall-active antibiotics response protein [Actinomycetia bacterium]|nr:cell wall-active antibiotics response protein [Actinomycetes bacterium]
MPRAAPFALPGATSQAPTVALPTAQQPPAPKPPREKSVLGRLTIGVLLLLTETLIALDVVDVINVEAVMVVAVGLAVVATGLLVGTFVGRSRGLIALGVALVPVLTPLAAIPNDVRWNTGAGAGERAYRVTSQQDLQPTYELGVGQITLDLRKLDPSEPLQFDASVGIGELRVLLPQGVGVSATADVAVGTINMPGEKPLDGVDVTRTWESTAQTDFSARSLDLTLSTGLGQIDVIENTVEVVR